MPVIPKLTKKHYYPVIHKRKYDNQSAEYYNRHWRFVRDNYFIHHPLCERCLQRGRITPAQHVHHIRPFLLGNTKAERLRLLQDPNNLMSLCITCHQIVHKELAAKAKFNRGAGVCRSNERQIPKRSPRIHKI